MHFGDLNILDFGNTMQIVGVVYSRAGEEGLFLPLPGEEHPDSFAPVDMTLADWQDLLRQTDLVETEVLARTSDGKTVKAILRKSARQISQQVSWSVYRRDGCKCRYCGADDVPLTVDHLVLWSEGGPSTEPNLVACCKRCNRTRGETSYDEWIRSKYYKKVAKNLHFVERQANFALAATLDQIPRRVHQVKR